MKDSELVDQKMTDDAQEQNGENFERRERSRGKRRTAREIARMFEELKMRHSTRKQEWKEEKEELLKQASLAEESKHLLVELKGILEDLKSQVSMEESKRKSVETEFMEGIKEWKTEKERLLKIIANLEKKHSSGFSSETKVAEKLENTKSQLVTTQNELAAVRKSNLEKQRSMLEMRHNTEAEKRRLLEEHSGEKRNWEKTKRVMLEKIETLQKELKHSRTPSFPLHGKHLGSPLEDMITDLTSPDTDDIFCHHDNRNQNNISDLDKRPYNSASNQSESDRVEERENNRDFNKTVDEALHQIQKITQGLDQVGTKNHSIQKSSNVASHLLQNPLGNVKGNNKQMLSDNSSSQNNQGSKLETSKLTTSLSPPNQSDQSPYCNSSSSDLKVYGEKKMSTQIESFLKPHSNVTQIQNTSTKEMSRRKSSLLESTDYSLSPSSCSIPTFTESSAESPQDQLFGLTKDFPVAISVQVNNSKPMGKFSKNEKSYQDEVDKNSKLKAPKALPNLHQQLLFGSAPASSRSPGNFPSQEQKFKTKDKTLNSVLAKSLKDSSSPNSKESQKYDALKTQTISKVIKQSFLPSFDFVEDNIHRENQTSAFTPSDSGTTEKSPHLTPKAPPVRPKPSVTIEKDTQGNLLRVISDPNYRNQETSKSNISGNDQEVVQERMRRRRSEEVDHDLEPLVSESSPLSFEKTSQNIPQKSIMTQKSNQSISKDVKSNQKESIGSKGKTWIKKRFSFLDNTTKNDFVRSPKTNRSPKKRNRASNNLLIRNTDPRRNNLDPSSSEESDRLVQSLSQSEKKGLESRKCKTKRYTRSKTDGSVDVKNLLLKFKSSQFRSKKPSIVKEFEKKLLENEIRALEEEPKANTGSRRKEESTRKFERVRVKADDYNDDGYSGEDELECNLHPEINSKNNNSYLIRSSSMRSLQEQNDWHRNDSSNVSMHRSLMDLSSFDLTNSNADEFERKSFLQTPSRSSVGDRKSPQRSVQHVKTTFSSLPKTTPSVEDQIDSTMTKQFNRASHNRLSLPERNHFGNKVKKRLSWASSLQENIEEEEDNENKVQDRSETKNINSTSTSFGGILLKPKPNNNVSEKTLGSSSVKEITNRMSENETSKRQISEKMREKAAKIENVLKRGANSTKKRRYKRSDTQPIKCTPTPDESESELIIQDFAKENLPNLNLRFKKPTPASRRLPSRWKKSSK